MARARARRTRGRHGRHRSVPPFPGAACGLRGRLLPAGTRAQRVGESPTRGIRDLVQVRALLEFTEGRDKQSRRRHRRTRHPESGVRRFASGSRAFGRRRSGSGVVPGGSCLTERHRRPQARWRGQSRPERMPPRSPQTQWPVARRAIASVRDQRALSAVTSRAVAGQTVVVRLGVHAERGTTQTADRRALRRRRRAPLTMNELRSRWRASVWLRTPVRTPGPAGERRYAVSGGRRLPRHRLGRRARRQRPPVPGLPASRAATYQHAAHEAPARRATVANRVDSA